MNRTTKTITKKVIKTKIQARKMRTRWEMKERTKRIKKIRGIKKKINNPSRVILKKSSPQNPNKLNFLLSR